LNECSVEKVGKTVDEAVKLALDELSVGIDMVDIEVLDEGNKGIFGLFGNKVAKVRVSLKNTGVLSAKNFLLDVFEKMKVSANIDISENDESIIIGISGDDIGIIIGRRGETLDSLQYLTSLVVNKGTEKYKRVVVDIENYRQKREETLVKLANKLADRVIKYRKSVTLEPMNPYERRIIHSSLQDNKLIRTYSVGDEPNRKVVITVR
jgi:spoIIIJ-associated protein